MLKDIRGILRDLDGVLYVGKKVIPGTATAIRQLRDRGYQCRFITNTSTRSRQALHQQIVALGLPVQADEIISATTAAASYLHHLGDPA